MPESEERKMEGQKKEGNIFFYEFASKQFSYKFQMDSIPNLKYKTTMCQKWEASTKGLI